MCFFLNKIKLSVYRNLGTLLKIRGFLKGFSIDWLSNT